MATYQVSFTLNQTVIADTPEEAALLIANALATMTYAKIVVDGKVHHITADSFEPEMY